MLCRPIAVATALGVTVSLVAQQSQQPVFRAGTETVAIYATVLDQFGGLVTNLPRSAFEVFDEGKRQDLTVFVNGLQPVTAILLIDTSASMAPTLSLARLAAEQFVIRLFPGDQARVGSFSDRIDLSDEFTGDRDELLRAIREDLHIGNPTRLWDAVDLTMTELAPLGGRRVILLLTDGMDTYSEKRADDLLTRARADELMVYAIQIRSRARPGVENALAPGPRAMLFSDPARNPPPGEALRRLAAQTGGGYFVLGAQDDVNATFTRVAYELHHQYVLGFSLQKFDGKTHDLDVHVKDPRMVVRARRSYLAPRR